MNITNTGLSSYVSIPYQINDLVAGRQSSSERQAIHEMDKQVEDNATWYFEYRALLNSILTTLTTKLTTAYTTDMDAAMGALSGRANGGNVNWSKNAMQGITGTGTNGSTIDPGAARTAVAYFNTFSNGVRVTDNSTIPPAIPPGADNVNSTVWANTANTPANTTTSVRVYSLSTDNGDPNSANISLSQANGVSRATGFISGTTTFISGSGVEGNDLTLDYLPLDFVDDKNGTGTGIDVDGDGIDEIKGFISKKTEKTGTLSGALIGNNFENVLFKFFSGSDGGVSVKQALDLINFGLFENVFVVGTSSLPTGSQVQGSLALNWNANAGAIKITQERFTAFFHS